MTVNAACDCDSDCSALHHGPCARIKTTGRWHYCKFVIRAICEMWIIPKLCSPCSLLPLKVGVMSPGSYGSAAHASCSLKYHWSIAYFVVNLFWIGTILFTVRNMYSFSRLSVCVDSRNWMETPKWPLSVCWTLVKWWYVTVHSGPKKLSCCIAGCNFVN